VVIVTYRPDAFSLGIHHGRPAENLKGGVDLEGAVRHHALATYALAQAALHTGVEPELAEDRRSVSRLPYPNAAQGRQP